MITIFWRYHYYKNLLFHKHLCGDYLSSHDNEPLVHVEEKRRGKLMWGQMNSLITKRFVGTNTGQRLFWKNK